MRRTLAVFVVLSGAVTHTLPAQNSVFGVLGVGFPVSPIGVRSRALAGAFGPFDPRAAINPASTTGFGRLTAMATSGTTLRSYTALDTVADGLRETRFPFGMLGGSLRNTPVSYAVSYSTYAERTYEFSTRDTVTIRGEDIGVVDRVASDGAIVDMRGALGFQIVNEFRVGAAVHLISGSAALTTQRGFESTSYAFLQQRNRLGFSALGFSAGFVITPGRRFALAGSVRSDSKLETTRDSVPVGDVDLPMSLTGGVFLAPHPAIGWSTSVEWRSWSDAAADLAAVGTEQAFDTWTLATGVEIGGQEVGGAIPIRLGLRYGQLPFSPTSDQAREVAVAGGTAIRFAGDRATVELSLERAVRSGAGADETAWHFSFGLTVRP